jgi:hypothetical protein
MVDVDENIYVFAKNGFNPATKEPVALSIFDFL